MNVSDAKPVLQVENLECRYDDEVILRNVSFTVEQGEIFYIAGPSGCGKTTLLRHLLGLLTPAAGSITYFGRNFGDATLSERRDIIRSFGVLFQNNALWTDLTLAENVSLPLSLRTRVRKETRDEITAFKLAQVGLSGFEDRLPRHLSGGMRKRAALARALALDPSIVFLDEPTAGLDPITGRQIDQLIRQVRETVGATVIVVSHSLSSIFYTADRIILLDPQARGVIATGSPVKLARTSQNSRVTDFLGEPPAGLAAAA